MSRIACVPGSSSSGTGWSRRGSNVCYYQNHIKRKNGYYYTLTFTIEFEHDHDKLYFAHCYPYSYRDLQVYLRAAPYAKWKSNIIRFMLHPTGIRQ